MWRLLLASVASADDNANLLQAHSVSNKVEFKSVMDWVEQLGRAPEHTIEKFSRIRQKQQRRVIKHLLTMNLADLATRIPVSSQERLMLMMRRTPLPWLETSLVQENIGSFEDVVSAKKSKKTDETTKRKGKKKKKTKLEEGGYSRIAAQCKPDGQEIGVAMSGLSLPECQEHCTSHETRLCAAFEFEFATGTCRVFQGVDTELALQHGGCNDQSCCYGRPLPAPEGYSNVAARCKPDGQSIGTEQTGKTLAECTAMCNAEPRCAAFEFEFATGECEMVAGVDIELSLQDEDGPCNGEGCCYGRPLPAPEGYSNVAARCKPDGQSIGTEQTGKTLSECTAMCNAEPRCAAFEFEFATGECEMVAGVDIELSLQDEDGPCNGEGCCYATNSFLGGANPSPPSQQNPTPAPTASGRDGNGPVFPSVSSDVCSSNADLGRKCDWVSIADLDWFKYGADESIEPDKIRRLREPAADADPCLDFRGEFYRVDGGRVAEGEEDDGAFSTAGYKMNDDVCKIIRWDDTDGRWVAESTCGETKVAYTEHLQAGGATDFPFGAWYSPDYACLNVVNTFQPGLSCVKDGGEIQCGREEEAVCREGNDLSASVKPRGSTCPGGKCEPSNANVMTCQPQAVVDCIGKVEGDACSTNGSCTAVANYQSASPRYRQNMVTTLVCK